MAGNFKAKMKFAAANAAAYALTKKYQAILKIEGKKLAGLKNLAKAEPTLKKEIDKVDAAFKKVERSLNSYATSWKNLKVKDITGDNLKDKMKPIESQKKSLVDDYKKYKEAKKKAYEAIKKSDNKDLLSKIADFAASSAADKLMEKISESVKTAVNIKF